MDSSRFGPWRWARAILLGLGGVVVVCGLTYFNDEVLRQTFLVGNNMPIFVYGGLILCLLLVNPVLSRLRTGLGLSAPELAVIMAMTLSACCIPSSGLMRTFNTSLILPHHWAKTQPGWKENRVIEMAPRQMLVDVSRDEDRVLTRYLQGMKQGTAAVRVSDVPWDAWTGPLLFWLPVVLSLWIALLGLSLVVHPQWSAHEQLPYPIASITDALLPRTGGAMGGVFGNRLFWVAGTVAFLIHTSNYVALWAPRHWIGVPLRFDFSGFFVLFPKYQGGLWWIQWPTLHLTVVGIAFFLATDVSLALGVGPLLYTVISLTLASYGVSLSAGTYFAANPEKMLAFGAYLGAACILFYTGRNYYTAAFRRAFFLSARTEVEPFSVTGARVFVAATAVFVFLLAWAGLDWPLAVLFALGTQLMFLVMARIMAETGAFFLQSYWMPGSVMVALFGMRALGPETALILLMVSLIVTVDPREAFMPFVVNALKMNDLRGVQLARVALLCAVAVAVGLAVAVPVTTYLQYSHGAPWHDGWACDAVATGPFRETLSNTQRLQAQGVLDEARSVSGLGRFAAASLPKPAFLIALAAGLGAFLLFSLARLRFARWPVHPVMFLVWVTYPAKMFAFSFLIGWMAKGLVMKYGGARVYQGLKPLMIGLIAGEILGGVVPMLIGFALSLLGRPDLAPPQFGIMPH